MQVLSSVIFRWGAGGEGGGWRQRRSGGKKEREEQVFWSLPCPVLYRVILIESELAASAAAAPFIEV